MIGPRFQNLEVNAELTPGFVHHAEYAEGCVEG
jgi:hypothetical protein